jgi:hypothetical protein
MWASEAVRSGLLRADASREARASGLSALRPAEQPAVAPDVDVAKACSSATRAATAVRIASASKSPMESK